MSAAEADIRKIITAMSDTNAGVYPIHVSEIIGPEATEPCETSINSRNEDDDDGMLDTCSNETKLLVTSTSNEDDKSKELVPIDDWVPVIRLVDCSFVMQSINSKRAATIEKKIREIQKSENKKSNGGITPVKTKRPQFKRKRSSSRISNVSSSRGSNVSSSRGSNVSTKQNLKRIGNPEVSTIGVVSPTKARPKRSKKSSDVSTSENGPVWKTLLRPTEELRHQLIEKYKLFKELQKSQSSASSIAASDALNSGQSVSQDVTPIGIVSPNPHHRSSSKKSSDVSTSTLENDPAWRTFLKPTEEFRNKLKEKYKLFKELQKSQSSASSVAASDALNSGQTVTPTPDMNKENNINPT